jgi:hypothetical protein
LVDLHGLDKFGEFGGYFYGFLGETRIFEVNVDPEVASIPAGREKVIQVRGDPIQVGGYLGVRAKIV